MQARRHALIDPQRQPCNGVFRRGEDHLLKDVIEIDEPSSVVVEHRDRSAAVDVRPELDIVRVFGAQHGRAS